MADVTLLDVIRVRFGVAIDPDSDSGQILSALVPDPPLANTALTGKARLGSLRFVPTAGGISVRAVQGANLIVFTPPNFNLVDFTIEPPGGVQAVVSVELTLVSFPVKLPFLRAAQATHEGTLQAAPGDVQLHLPDLLLVVTAGASPRLAPSHGATGGLEVTMTPSFALIGPGTVLGFGFDRAVLNLDAPGGPEITAPVVQFFVAPPGTPALALNGRAQNLRIGLGTDGGLSGDFTLALAGGAAARPNFLHQLACRLRLVRNAVTLLEITGQIDVQGAVETRLGGTLGDPGGPDAVNFTLSLVLDAGWRTALAVTASGGQGFLWRTQRPNPDAADVLRDTLGAYAIFAPLLAPNLPGAGSSGCVDLALAAGSAGGLVAAGLVGTQSVTVYGGELIVQQPSGGSPEGFLFFDVETELNVTAKPLLTTRRPIKVRHKAIGFRLDFGADGGHPQPRPVFDPTRGFSLDLSDPGIFEMPAPLADILQPEGARMARQNPLIFEVDLVLRADLGVVTVDRATVRIPIDPAGPPTITALGAHVDIPGALSGSGYLKVDQDGFAGSLDVSVGPLGLRASADLSVEAVRDPATGEDEKGVLANVDLELPVPIPLANSGLGLFGFLGLFAMHFQRNQGPRESALDWLKRVGGDATKRPGWITAAHQWAFGMGAVLGTVEGGFLAHAKGMVVIELPGPGFLLVMNADILSARPGRTGTDMGKFLAVIAIRPESLTIGIILQYGIKPIFEVRVPVEVFFDFVHAERWHLDVGGIPPGKAPALTKFLLGLRAEGYLLIHGDGIADFPLGRLPGFAVAAGVRAALVWGPEPIGLYIKVAAQVDVGISFKPFILLGSMKISGELHLFIVGIEVSADATVMITGNSFFIHADVCGKINFFFFDVEGCVTLELGDRPPLPPADPMLRAVSLHSRTPALLPGSGTDRAVDGSLGDAFHFDRDPRVNKFVGNTPDARIPVVPIDAIPVLQFEMWPFVPNTTKPFGNPLESKLPAGGYARRGERFYRYTLKSVFLSSVDANNAPFASPVDEGDTPCTWWDRYDNPTGGDDNDVQLALLSWNPDPTPAAAERTVSYDQRVSNRWGDVCTPIAQPANVLWTFRPMPVGPSAAGWTLRGTPSPDEPGTKRSAPPAVTLRVTEPWRSGNPVTDAMMRVDPAVILGSTVVAERLLIAPVTGDRLRPLLEDPHFQTLFEALGPHETAGLADAVRLGDDLGFVRLLLFVQRDLWLKSGLLRLRSLDAAGLANGLELLIDQNNAREILNRGDLPAPWRDPAGTWLVPVGDVMNAWFEFYDGNLREPQLVVVEAKLPPGTSRVEIGAVTADKFPVPHWGILIVEGLTQAEETRAKFDEQARQSQIDVVNGALSADQAKRALLHPNATYTLTVDYDVEVADVDAGGAPKPAAGAQPEQQRFMFKTDSLPPHRLDPWVLATDPGPAEDFFFWADPLRVVFSTNATRKLFKAYGRELFAVVRAASGNDPLPTPGFDADRVSLSNAIVAAKPLPAAALTPWEAAERSLLVEQPCVNQTFTDIRHERITLTMKLKPLTNYVLDVEAEPTVGDPLHPLFRRNFNTSRYQSMQAMAGDVAQTPVLHRRVASAAALVTLGTQNPGTLALQVRALDIEQALRTARWGDLSRIVAPRVTVIWQDGQGANPPQPVALLLETLEPLWRFRGVPEEVPDDTGTRHYKLKSEPWLDVVEVINAGPLVSRFVFSAGGGRTLVLLGPNARGAMLSLALRRTHNKLFEDDTNIEMAPLATANLATAPWEDIL